MPAGVVPCGPDEIMNRAHPSELRGHNFMAESIYLDTRNQSRISADWRRSDISVDFLIDYLCGEISGAVLGGVVAVGPPGRLGCDADPTCVAGTEPDAFTRGRTARPVGNCGCVVMAVSGFSRCSWSGPRPSLINARESGTLLFCQP